MAEWRWYYAVDTCGAKDDRPLETEIDIRKSSNQPLEMELELNFDGMWNLRAKRWTMGTMNTFGLGHDVVDVAAFAEQLGQPGSHMRALFSVREVRQAEDRARQKNDGEAVHLAAKWAGKEAFLKAWCDFLGSAPFPFTLDNFPWREIEILDDSRGVPHVSLSGDASPAFQTDYSGSIPDVRISLSHDGPVASAVVMIQSGNDSREIR